jgi:integrase
MAIALTDQAIANATRRAKETKKRVEFVDANETGLWLRVTPTGLRSWSLVLRDPVGKLRRHQLGLYPAVGIAAAREAARRQRHAVTVEGADPTADRRQRRTVAVETAAGIGTLKAAIEAYGNSVDAPASWQNAKKSVLLVFKGLLDKRALSLSLSDFRAAQDRYENASTLSFASRSLRPALKWAAKRGLINEECTKIEAKNLGSRSRYLSKAELKPLITELKASDKAHCKALLFMLLTMTRKKEVTAATWQEIDLKEGIWTIPGDRTKNEKPHILSLSRQAIALLQNLTCSKRPTDLLFPSKAKTMLGNWDRETKKVQDRVKVKNFHRHDLRRTSATMLADIGTPPYIIEALLNHAIIHSEIAAVYDRSQRRPETKAALQALADFYDNLLGINDQ